jgi:hypothetical protein
VRDYERSSNFSNRGSLIRAVLRGDFVSSQERCPSVSWLCCVRLGSVSRRRAAALRREHDLPRPVQAELRGARIRRSPGFSAGGLVG